MFVTLFAGVLNVTTGRLLYANGGHNPPLFARAGQPFTPLPMPKGMLLGVFDQARYPVAGLTLRPDDALVIYTDGVTEAENTQRAIFSEARAIDVLSTVAPPRETTQLIKSLEEAIRHFAKGQPQSDDITLLALRFLAAQS
jgi:sigma-B regulation protein RsbU (phosphoserine phosphatase)